MDNKLAPISPGPKGRNSTTTDVAPGSVNTHLMILAVMMLKKHNNADKIPDRIQVLFFLRMIDQKNGWNFMKVRMFFAPISNFFGLNQFIGTRNIAGNAKQGIAAQVGQ